MRRPVFGSGFSPDCYYASTVEVADGIVVRRILAAPELEPGGDPSQCTELAFDEMGADVGSHDSSFAVDAMLFDAYYESCCEDILTIMPADEYDISFGTFDNGVVSRCTAYAHGCGEGCTDGPEGFGDSAFEIGFGPLPG